MFDPFAHAASVTGQVQVPLVDAYEALGIAVALSEVHGPHVYDYGTLPVPVVVITLCDVEHHVLIVDGCVRREGRVQGGRFRIGQVGQNVIVDAVPAETASASERKLLLVYLGPRLLEQVAGEMPRSAIEFRDQPWDIEDPFLHQLAQRLVDTATHHSSIEHLLAEQIGATLGLHLIDRYALNHTVGPVPALHLSALARIVEFIQTPEGLRASLADLAAIAGYSTSHFLRQFRAATGSTPHQFVQRQRLIRARELLSRTRQPLTKIALECGYASQSHFGTKFLHATGMTPRQYREIRRGR